MVLLKSRHTLSPSPRISQLDFPEVARSFHASYSKLQGFVTEDITLPALAAEVDLSSFWTAFEKRTDERNRELVVLVTWRRSDNDSTQRSSYDRSATEEMDKIANRLQAELDVLDLMHRRIQKRKVLSTCLCSWNERQKATAGEGASAIKVCLDTEGVLAPPAE